MKNRSYWISAFIAFLLFAGMFAITGCRVFDFFSKDSSPSNGSVSYAPPLIPETLEQEQPVVKARLNELSQALIEKNVDKAVELCVRKDFYKQFFLKHKDKLPSLGETIKTGQLTSVGAGYTSSDTRIGEVSVDIGSTTFGITILKSKGQWLFQDL